MKLMVKRIKKVATNYESKSTCTIWIKLDYIIDIEVSTHKIIIMLQVTAFKAATIQITVGTILDHRSVV